MRNLSIMLKNALLAFSIPLGIKGFCYFAENPMPSLFPNQNSSSTISEGENSISWISKLNCIISATLTDYLSFILMMLILSLFVEFIKVTSRYFISPAQTKSLFPQSLIYSSSLDNEEGFSWKRKGAIVLFCKLMACFTILFGLCQLTLMMGKLNFDDDPVVFDSEDLNTVQLPQTQNYRSLDQLSSEEAFEERITSPNQNPGEILGSFSLKQYFGDKAAFDCIGALLSNDGKTLFGLFQPNRFSIFNISNPKKEQRIGLINLDFYPHQPIMLLSQDEKTLYLRELHYYLIIDISNHSAPILKFGSYGINRDTGLSFVMSSDKNLLFSCVNETLEIFNLSQPISPTLIYKKTVGPLTTLALFNDNSKMILSRSDNFEIFNVTDPTNPILIHTGKKSWKTPQKIALSNDGKRLLTAGTDQKALFFQVSDISNWASPFLISSTELGQSISDEISLWFDQNRHFAFYVVKNQFKMISIEKFEQTMLFRSSSLAFTLSPSSQRSVVFIDGKAVIMRFNIDMGPQSLPHFKPNAFTIIDEVDPHRRNTIGLSKDEKLLYLMRIVETDDRELIPFERLGNSSYRKLSPIQLPRRTFYALKSQWSFLTGAQSLCLAGTGYDKGEFYFLKNLNASVFNFEQSSSQLAMKSIALAEDEKTIVFTNTRLGYSANGTLNIITFKDGKENSFMNFEIPDSKSAFIRESSIRISRDGRIVFCAGSYILWIYDISNPALPLLKSSFKFSLEGILGITFAKDEKIVYLVGYQWHWVAPVMYKRIHVQILDVSNIENPRFHFTEHTFRNNRSNRIKS